MNVLILDYAGIGVYPFAFIIDLVRKQLARLGKPLHNWLTNLLASEVGDNPCGRAVYVAKAFLRFSMWLVSLCRKWLPQLLKSTFTYQNCAHAFDHIRQPSFGLHMDIGFDLGYLFEVGHGLVEGNMYAIEGLFGDEGFVA